MNEAADCTSKVAESASSQAGSFVTRAG
jgi:hypothetical protein